MTEKIWPDQVAERLNAILGEEVSLVQQPISWALQDAKPFRIKVKSQRAARDFEHLLQWNPHDHCIIEGITVQVKRDYTSHNGGYIVEIKLDPEKAAATLDIIETKQHNIRAVLAAEPEQGKGGGIIGF